jgi:hypothetical protein
MGWASRANPRSFASDYPERDVLNARLDRFFEAFATRADYEQYLNRAKVDATEWAYLETRIPDRLKLVAS